MLCPQTGCPLALLPAPRLPLWQGRSCSAASLSLALPPHSVYIQDHHLLLPITRCSKLPFGPGLDSCLSSAWSPGKPGLNELPSCRGSL